MMDFKNMFLESSSGYMVPFLMEREDDDVEIMLGYGDQIHPSTGERFFHHGVDFVCDHLPLLAVASGIVVGVGHDDVLEDFIVTRYGKYQVRYGHVSEVFCPYGSRVTAGQEIARSGGFLHLDVRFDGEELDPQEFLKMLYGNVSVHVALNSEHFPESVASDVDVMTPYDKDKDEIEALMEKWLPAYFSDIFSGAYEVSERTNMILGNLMEQAARRGCFYQELPSYSNPVGIGADSADVAGEAQGELIRDFLGWLAVRHQIYVSSWTEDEKKNLMRIFSPTGR